ncbi:hypothetical protein [Streptomyces sp. TRM68367]|uniref:hypothetical protein n=1 Tax=Streptomyces sp. TRM68367 TaxID=2758415 RepID=UPI00165C291B|nr:hypothetical protein [Streptomyces sp. TRM68367]MBC9730349.1 hypothetical protein [Streptomyces sp. TRM68367]
MKDNKNSTVKAAKAEIRRETKNTKAEPTTQQTQGALADRHVRSHTPDSLYGDDEDATATE